MRMENLAKYILAKPTKLARRRFLEEFERRHGVEATDLLKAKILGLVQK